MYAPGKILVMGGGDPPTNTAEVIDLTAVLTDLAQLPPRWQLPGVSSMQRCCPTALCSLPVAPARGRVQQYCGLLPVYAAELWDPATEQWTDARQQQLGIPRVYHSSAVLLPDGRVLSMGGNGQTTSEIYSPPYLFKGTRPTITSALPQIVAYGQTFFVQVTSRRHAAITKVTMLRLSSVTHAFNMSQYISGVELFAGHWRSWRPQRCGSLRSRC